MVVMVVTVVYKGIGYPQKMPVFEKEAYIVHLTGKAKKRSVGVPCLTGDAVYDLAVRFDSDFLCLQHKQVVAWQKVVFE
jgi:hypothetical protein